MYKEIINEKLNEAMKKKVEEKPLLLSDERVKKLLDMFKTAKEDLPCYSLGLTSVSNARDLGGITLKNGKSIKKRLLLRSGSLEKLNEEDKKVLEDIGVCTVVDFRGKKESERVKDKDIKGCRNIVLPLADSVTSEYVDTLAYMIRNSRRSPEKAWLLAEYAKNIDMRKVYLLMLEKPALESIRRFFEILLEEDEKTVLFHCKSGKDRTGFAAALVLFALGCDKKTVIGDYFMSNAALYDNMNFYARDVYDFGYGMGTAAKLCEIVGVNDSNLTMLFNILEKEYGSIESFLQEEIKAGKEEIEFLRIKYLNDK